MHEAGGVGNVTYNYWTLAYIGEAALVFVDKAVDAGRHAVRPRLQARLQQPGQVLPLLLRNLVARTSVSAVLGEPSLCRNRGEHY